MPYLEKNILSVLRATGGADGGLTADQLAEVVFAPVGRVRMTLRRLLDRGVVRITQGVGSEARYLLSELHDARWRKAGADDRGWRHPEPEDFGWGQGRGSGPTPPPPGSGSEPELRRLREAVARLERDNAHLRAALTRKQAADTDDLGLESRLEVLIRLCHPDRHDNSERANEITRWLLDLRRRRKG